MNKNRNSTKKSAVSSKNQRKFANKHFSAEFRVDVAKLDSARDSAKNVRDSAKDSAKNAKDSTRDSAKKSAESAKNAKDSTRDSAKKSADSTKNMRDSTKLDSTQDSTKLSHKSPFKKRLKKYAKNSAIALLYAFIFTLPIYANIFTYLSIDILNGKNGVFLPYLNTIFALCAVASILKVDRKYRFYFGFWVGILWFYWMGMSFTHSYSSIMHFIPVALLLIGVIYGAVFYILLFFNALLWRIFTLSVIGHIAIFGFDWMVVPALFSFSIFRVGAWSFIFILFFVALCLHYYQKSRTAEKKDAKKRNFKRAIFALIPLIFVIDFSHIDVEVPPKIFISQMDVNQQIKWLEETQIVSERNFAVIDEAIMRGDKMVILPETAFPFALNTFERILQTLLEKSHQITIIAGAWHFENDKSFNATYIFENGEVEIRNKTFLAPFGEYLPLPKFLSNIFSKITGLQYGLEEARGEIGNVDSAIFSFRNAICYEATKREMYSDNPKYMVVISNNAWFAPSIQPVLQMMLIKYYARLYGTMVIHASNGSRSMVISPNTGVWLVEGV